MLEILKQNGFTEEEARTLESRDDYESVKLQVERVQIDNNLDALETRSTTAVETQSQTLEERWQAFKDALSQLEQSTWTSEPIVETLEAMQARLEQEAITKAETAIREEVWDIPLIGEGIASWLVSSWKEMISSATDTSMGWQIKKWFVMFVAWIFGVESIYSQLQESIDAAKNTQLPEVEIPEIVPNIEVPEETKDLLKYQAGIELILGLSENDDENTNIQSLLLTPKIQESKYSEIINDTFSIEGTDGDDVAIMKATLRSQESLIDSILKNENPNWRELSLLEIFESIGVYATSFADIRSITPDTILSGDFNIWTISFWEWFTAGWSLGALFEQYRNSESSIFHNVSEGLFLQLIRESGKKITDSDVENLLALNSFQEKEEDRRFQEEFVKFWRGFIDIIISEFYLGPDEHKEAFAQYIREKSLTYSEVLELMILTGGSLEVSSYNDAVKTIIYAKIWKILGEEDSFWHELRTKTYNAVFLELLQSWVSSWFENIPPEMKILVNKIFSYGTETAIEAAKETAWLSYELFFSVWDKLDWQTKASIIAGSWFMLYIIIQSRYFRGFVAWWAVIWGVALVWALIMMADSAWANPSFRAEHPDIGTKEELINGLIGEVSATGIDVSAAVEDIRAGRTTHDIDRSLIAPVSTGEESVWAVTPVNPDSPRDYPWIMYNWEKLQEDGMTTIPMEWDIVSQESGVLKIERNRATKEVKFYVNGVERNVYFWSQWWSMDRIADGMLWDSGIFVKNSTESVFLAILTDSTYSYVSLEELANKISQQASGELLISEDLYISWDLMMQWNS